jgi:alpha-L-rhamnosidase
MKVALKPPPISPLVPMMFAPMLLAQEARPWQQVIVPSTREVAANFKAPPREYGAIQPFQSWNGTDPAEVRQRISRDLDRLSANGIFIINLSPGRRDTAHGEPAYLSPGHMDQVKYTVAELAKRNMRMWIQDESDYPSGFAGGYISERYPQLGMQDIVADITVHVAPGQTLQMPVPPDSQAIWATELDAQGAIEKVIPIPVPADMQLKYLTPAEGTTPNEPRHSWQVQFLRHVYLSSPTRNFNRADGTRAKDGTYSIIDYLDPKATDAFLHTVHETYYGAVGEQFGKIVLGFFGDEPDYSSGIPWTPKLLEDFKAQKGYDLAPYIPSWFDHKPIDKADLAHADYYDVWSGIFQNSFFGEQANWAKAHNVEYLVHLNHEETMLALERSEGDYFRDERYVQVPGIDNLNQLIPSAVHTPDGTWNINNNFPKLASSAAHLFGKPKVWAEEGGGTGIDGKYQLDFQAVRGVNALQIRALVTHFGQDANASAPPPPAPPEAAMIAWYANRAGYLMAIGRPVAQVGLYHPGNSIWMGGDAATEADRSTTKLGWQLFEHQVDWDYFDEQSLSSVAKLENGGFINLSGQTYKAVVLPSMTVITRTGLERLKAFAAQGGKVIFVGKSPSLILDKTFMDAKEEPDLSFATLIEPSGDITPAVLAALPKPDAKVDADFPPLTYTHRQWTDGDMYYFFNESNKTESRMVTVAGHGKAQDWDLGTGEIHPMIGATADADGVKIPLVLAPYEAKVIVIGPLPKKVAAAEPSFAAGTTLAELTGDWNLMLNGKTMTTELKSWEDLGMTGFAGPATYRKEFTVEAAPNGKRVYLEIADVHDYAKVTLNGKELGAASWQPYRWDVTGALTKAANVLVIEVDAVAQSGRGGFGGPPPTAAATATPSALARGLATVPSAGADAGARRRQSTGTPGVTSATASAPPAPTGAESHSTAPAEPPASGLLGSVKLVAY